MVLKSERSNLTQEGENFDLNEKWTDLFSCSGIECGQVIMLQTFKKKQKNTYMYVYCYVNNKKKMCTIVLLPFVTFIGTIVSFIISKIK